MLAFRKCRRSDNSEEQPAITARKQRKQCRTTIKRFLYRRRARAIRSPTPLRGSVCVLASSSDIACDCGNSAVLPACREFSEHICSPNGRAEDALESALAMYVAAKEPLPTSQGALARDKVNTYVHPVFLCGRRAILPMHGGRKEMKRGTVAAIKTQLGLE